MPGIAEEPCSLVRSASAGGQLEQPSEVKSSMTTGLVATGAFVFDGEGDACEDEREEIGEGAAQAKKARNNASANRSSIKSENFPQSGILALAGGRARRVSGDHAKIHRTYETL